MKLKHSMFIIFLFTTLAGFASTPDTAKAKPKLVSISRKAILKTTLKGFGFKQTYPDPVFDHLDLPGNFTKCGADNANGKFARTIRFKNITLAAEDRWGLPRFFLMAIIYQESTGMDLLPNSSDDGGAGLAHMQPATAFWLGLNVYEDCGENTCKKHGRELRELIKEKGYDRKLLIRYDDRFHPIINVDAAARYLAWCIAGPLVTTDDGVKLDHIQSAIHRYAGGANYKAYYAQIVSIMATMQSAEKMRQVEDCFNYKSPKLTVNGDSAGYKQYLKVSQDQNYNYGLGTYQKMSKFSVKNAATARKEMAAHTKGATMLECGCRPKQIIKHKPKPKVTPKPKAKVTPKSKSKPKAKTRPSKKNEGCF